MNKERFNSPSDQRDVRLTAFGKKVVAGALVAAGAGLGIVTNEAVNAAEDAIRYSVVDTKVETLGYGETPIGAVEDAVETMARRQNIDPATVSGVVAAGQEVSAEIQARTGFNVVRPNDSMEIRLLGNRLGSYKVEADPSDQRES